MKTITGIHAWEILDSRGNPTIAVEMHSDDMSAIASVPSGKSTGKYEVRELRDGGSRYGGLGVTTACGNVNGAVANLANGMPLGEQEKFDRMLHDLDGTKNFSHIGANAAVGASFAYARLSAQVARVYLCDSLRGVFGDQHLREPKLYINILNGGAHAGGNLAIQEFHVIPNVSGTREAVELGVLMYTKLRELIAERYGSIATGIGDEGGLMPPVKSTVEAFDLLVETRHRCGISREISFGIDAAASNFYRDGKYHIDGKALDPSEMSAFWKKLASDVGLEALEDPFNEDDFASSAELTAAIGDKTLIIGDDLTVTDKKRIELAHAENAINAVIIKPNQIGTVTDTMEAARLARSYGWKLVVSHRSGETEDAFIADFAVGIGADAVKFGAPARGERTVKYNQLLKIFSSS